MRKDIPEEYPVELDDNNLLSQIKAYSKRATEGGRLDVYSVGPSYWKEMAELGQIEVSNRIQSKLLEQIQNLTTEIKLLKEDNEKSGRKNTILTFVTIGLALITLFHGFYTFYDSKSSQNSESAFKKNQLDLLRQNNNELIDIKNELKVSNQMRKK